MIAFSYLQNAIRPDVPFAYLKILTVIIEENWGDWEVGEEGKTPDK
jgi:hypothetical protein